MRIQYAFYIPDFVEILVSLIILICRTNKRGIDTMINECFNCGEYRADKIIDPSGLYAICPVCEYKHAFLQLPLLIVSGASGAGKSAVRNVLMGKINEAVMLEGDILWRSEFDKPKEKYREFFETWLRLCKSISQSGRSVVMFNAGMGVPENVEPCVERRYFSELHYLALVCEDEVLAERLRGRPKWRKSGDSAYIEDHIRFNRWFKEQGNQTESVIELIDTTAATLEETAKQVALWIRRKLECTNSKSVSTQQVTPTDA